MRVRVRRLGHAAGLPLPGRASAGSAGLDLRAAVTERTVLQPGERILVPTGLVLEIPPGFEGQIRPRSGLAIRHGVTVVNAPSTVDSDYRSEVAVALVNLGAEPFAIAHSDRIAQLVVARVEAVELEEVGELSDSDRKNNGFGSTKLN